MMMATTLLDIPSEVITTSFLPLLTVNQVLRTRRLCSWMKRLSEDHLRRHPTSRNQMDIYVLDREIGNYSPAKSLLREEEDLAKSAEELGLDPPIRKPVSRFFMEFQSSEDFGCPRVLEFISRYGNQIIDLYIRRPDVPLAESEVRFYQRLPKLKYLTVETEEVSGDENSTHELVEAEDLPFRKVFSKLTGLKIRMDCPSSVVWEFLESCICIKNFEYLNPLDETEEFKRLLTTFCQRRHKKLSHLDMETVTFIHINPEPKRYSQLMSALLALVTKCNLKLVNVSPLFFEKLGEHLQDQFATRVWSLAGPIHITCFHPWKILMVPSLPNVREVYLLLDCKRNTSGREQFQLSVSRNLLILFSTRVPNLRKMDLRICDNYPSGISSRILAGMWRSFPNLEALTFADAPVLEDVTFNGERGELPFLKLTKLKILHLGEVDKEYKQVGRREPKTDKVFPISDATFVNVFSQMKLVEFSFKSVKPLDRVTVAGIRALRAGPFGKTIELFSFDSWSLKGVSPEELRQISKEFPCNTF